VRGGERTPSFEKRSKSFCYLMRAAAPARALGNKSLLVLFFKKEHLSDLMHIGLPE
jgi:hypothetical protein